VADDRRLPQRSRYRVRDVVAVEQALGAFAVEAEQAPDLACL